MKVLVCGDRYWNNVPKIKERLAKLPEGTLILHGCCRGADTLAGLAAMVLGLPIQTFPADWEKHGLAAGPIRNRQMLDEKPDLVIAFHPDLSKSKGTADTVREAEKRGIAVEIVS